MTGVAVVCLAAARGVGVGVRWQLVVEEEGAGVENGLKYDALRVRSNRVDLSHSRSNVPFGSSQVVSILSHTSKTKPAALAGRIHVAISCAHPVAARSPSC